MTAAAGTPPGLWHRFLFAALITQLGVMLLGWCVVASVLSLLLPNRRATPLGQRAVSAIARWFFASARSVGMMQIDAEALDVLRDHPGGLILAANHPTMLDAFVVVSRLPRGVCVMKAELSRNVFLGAGARMARYIANDTGRGMVRDAVRTLREGNQLVLFPEGTRTVTPPVDAFKPGITLIAHLAQVPIQTVIIESRSPYLTKGWPLLRAPPVPVVIRASLGQRFTPDPDHRAMLRRLETYFAREVRR